MKLYILNMKTDIARKEFILDQLNILKIKNYEFVEAVNGKEHISDNNCDADKFKNQYFRDILPGEWGCATSHLKVYDKIIQTNEISMVLEDDAIFDAESINIIKVNKVRHIKNDSDAIQSIEGDISIIHNIISDREKR